jgi:predicted component of type VI protein secretion system
MKLHLIVLSEGKAKGTKIPVTLSQFLIGRDPQCHLRPASPIISKRHCMIQIKDGKVLVRDFSSTNGTFVNDVPVTNEHELHNDDVLQVGPISFRVELLKSVSVNKPTPPPATANSETDDEASIAAMLLDFQGDDSSSTPTGEDSIPSGTTMMDIPVMGDTDESKPAEKKEEKESEKKVEVPKTSSAAAAEILAKYSRRTRK